MRQGIDFVGRAGGRHRKKQEQNFNYQQMLFG